jgi:hypothetical protein
MKNLMRVSVVAIVFMLLIPQVTFAAWWNPLSWNIFNRPAKTQIQQVQVATTTIGISVTSTTKATSTPPKVLNKKVSQANQNTNTTQTVQPAVQQQPITTLPQITSWTDLESKYFAEANQKGWTNQTITNEAGEKQYYRLEAGTWVQKDTLAEAQQSYQPPAPPNTTLCNGTYWFACPAGQEFICTTDGKTKPYCQVPPPAATATQIAGIELLCSTAQSQGNTEVIKDCNDGTILNGYNTNAIFRRNIDAAVQILSQQKIVQQQSTNAYNQAYVSAINTANMTNQLQQLQNSVNANTAAIQQQQQAQQQAQQQLQYQQQQQQFQQELQQYNTKPTNCSLGNLIQNGMYIPGCN